MRSGVAAAVTATTLRLLVGVLLGGILGVIFTGDWTYSIVWSVALVLMIAASIVLVARKSSSGGTILALARIETIRRAGLETDGMQDCELRLVVSPSDRKPYVTTIRSNISTEALRAHVPGTVIVVSRPAPRLPAVHIVPAPATEWLAKAAAAQSDPSSIPPASAVTVWETTSVPQPRRSGSVVATLVLVATIVAGASLALIPSYTLISWRLAGFAAGEWNATDMKYGSHQQDAIDQIADVAGSYQFTDIGFHDSYVIVSGLTSPQASTVDRYSWRYGRATRDGADLIQPQDLQAELFDASELDFSVLPQAAKTAIEQSGLEPTDVYLQVRMPASFDASMPQQPLIFVHVNDDYFDASFSYTFELELVHKSGTVFER